MPVFFAVSVILRFQVVRVYYAIMSTKVHFAAIHAPFATARTKVFAGGYSEIGVSYAVILINRGAVALARDVFFVILAVIAPVTKNGRCTPTLFYGGNRLRICARCAVSCTGITLAVLALFVSNGTMAMIAYCFSCHLRQLQLISLAIVATCGTALTCATPALHLNCHHQ